MSRFETPDSALRRAQTLMQREGQRLSSFGAAAQRMRRMRRTPTVSLSEQNRLTRELFSRSSPEDVRRLQTLTPAQQLQEARGQRLTAPSDIGSPTGEAVFPGVVGKIPGLRTPAEAASTIGTAGMGSIPMAAKAGGLALGLGGAFGGGEAAEQLGAPRPLGEAIGGLSGGLTGSVAGPMAARRIGGQFDVATQRAGGVGGLLGEEVGGTKVPRVRLRPEKETQALPTPVAKLATAIRNAGKVTQEQKTMFAQQRGQRTAAASGALEAGIARGEGAAAFGAAKGELKGEFARPQFAVPDFDQADMHGLVQGIGTADVPFYTKLHAQEALEEVARGRIPQPALLRELFKVHPELVKAIQSKRSLGTKAWSEMVSFLGLPQKLKSTFDYGSRMRQGLVLGWSHPRQWLSNWKPTTNAMFTEKSAQDVMTNLERNPWYSIEAGEKAGLGFADQGGHIYHWDPLTPGMERVEGFQGMNEGFITRATDKIPGILGSQRSFATDLNKSGVEVYAQEAQAMWNAGTRDPDQYKALASVVNHARGYGSFNPGQIAQGVHAFFSGRNLVARFQVLLDPIMQPGSLLKPSARQLAAKNLVGLVAGDMALLGLIGTAGAATGMASVEMNPLKPGADWLKVKVGNSRIDPWGGFQPLARLIVRAGAAAATETGVKKTEWNAGLVKRELVNFFTNKEAPLVRLLTDAAGLTDRFPGTATKPSPEMLADLYAPFVSQDIYEAVKEHGLAGIGIAAPSTVGVAVQTYAETPQATAYKLQRYEGISPEEEDQIYEFRKEADYEYQQARRAEVEITRAEVAEILGEETGRKELGTMAAAAIRNELPLNKEKIQFAIDHQDELDAKTLLRIVPDEILRDELTPENFERVFKR